MGPFGPIAPVIRPTVRVVIFAFWPNPRLPRFVRLEFEQLKIQCDIASIEAFHSQGRPIRGRKPIPSIRFREPSPSV